MRKPLAAVLREPIVHFLLAGLLLYGAATLWSRAMDPQRIVVTDADVAQLSQRYVQQFSAPPSAERLAYLIDRHIRDEALHREGLALGLGQGDEVVRRRLIQKMEFLNEGDGDVSEPEKGELQQFYEANAQRYLRPSRVSFAHVYFSPDRGGEVAARARAADGLARLQAGEQGDVSGDRFSGQESFTLISPEEAEHVFGRTELAQALYELPIGGWVGPVRSGYGWHLLRIGAREPSHAPVLSEIDEELRADWQAAQRERLKQERLAKLLRSYKVVREYRTAPGVIE